MTAELLFPHADEHAPYFSMYLDLATHMGAIEGLKNDLIETPRFFRTISDEMSLKKYADGKWSIREVLGHIIDNERIFVARALRIARGDTTPQTGYDENALEAHANHHDRDWSGIIEEFELVRRSSLAFFESLAPDSDLRRGVVSDREISVRTVPYLLHGHAIHHSNVVRERYL